MKKSENEQLTNDELYEQNTIGIKLEKQKRVYKSSIPFHTEKKKILRTKYLKLCWACGSPYESYRYDSFACSHRCRQNIRYRRKKGLDPLARMSQLTKEKNIEPIKEYYRYN